MLTTSTSILLCTLILSCSGIKLPDYFLRCSINDPHFSQCISDGGNLVLPKLISGNKDFNFPPFAIFDVPDIVSSACETGIKLKLVNVTAGDLEDARAALCNFDIPNKLCNITIYFPRLKVTGNYELEGNIDGLAVRGAGQADITFIDVYSKLFWIFGIQKKNGVRHLDVLNLIQSYEIKGARYSFSGLTKGDGKALEERATDHINNNWRILEKLISPAVMESFRKIAFHIGKTVNDFVPLDEVFARDI